MTLSFRNQRGKSCIIFKTAVWKDLELELYVHVQESELHSGLHNAYYLDATAEDHTVMKGQTGLFPYLSLSDSGQRDTGILPLCSAPARPHDKICRNNFKCQKRIYSFSLSLLSSFPFHFLQPLGIFLLIYH